MDDEMYGLHSTPPDHDHNHDHVHDNDYSHRASALMMSDPHNLNMINSHVDYLQFNNYNSMLPSLCYNQRSNIHQLLPEEYSVAVNNHDQEHHNEQAAAAAAAVSVIKAKIASHPSYPKLIDAYIDCQKVGAPPEMASFLDEVRREKGLCKLPMSLGIDPELDEFMETYYDILVKYKSDLSRPFDEATSFLNKIETQLRNLCKDDGSLSSDDELSGGDVETPDTQTRSEDGELKDKLLRRYGSHISSLKLEFSKKKKKGKLPKESRQTLLEWWNVHYKWPYPTEADKISLAELTGLDQKQINNWFINQRKRHWKPSENMQLAIMNNLSGHFFTDD